MWNISKEGSYISVLSMDIRTIILINLYMENNVLSRKICYSNNTSVYTKALLVLFFELYC